MENNRQNWNARQALLRQALLKGNDHSAWLDLFLQQHGALHTAGAAQNGDWSYEDDVWQGLSPQAARRIPAGCEHSIAWVLWHLARIEDVTMHILAAGEEQVLRCENWQERLKTAACDTGNGMSPEEVNRLSQEIDLEALRAYRASVGRSTRRVVQNLETGSLQRRIDAPRLQRALDEGAVLPRAVGLIEYWGGLTVAGLLLMPPTRHNFVHLNEAAALKKKRA